MSLAGSSQFASKQGINQRGTPRRSSYDTMECMLNFKAILSRWRRDAHFDEKLESLRKRTPVPVFWLFGKTQSGKTSIIKYLTGADNAEIGKGFQPCTRFSRLYQFPSAETPLLSFLDTRGLDEPGYDPTEDLARFNHETHLV